MFRPLTIFEKGILIVSIPVVAQAIFIGVLIKLMSEDAAAQRWAVHSKQVISKIEESYRLLLGGYAGVRNLIVLQSPIGPDPFIRDLERVPEAVGELRALVADNRPQQARVDELVAHSRAFSGLLGELQRLVGQGQRARAIDQLDDASGALRDMRTDVDAILREELRLDQERMKTMYRANAWHFWVLIGGGVATLSATIGLAVVFFQRIVKRLEVLRENSRLLARGEVLNPPLSGGDDLALLDRAFREMASSLLEQKQENEMFVYSVSHDLRSPLINLQGFSEELRLSSQNLQDVFDRAEIPRDLREDGRRLLDGSVIESIRYIQAAVDRLARIIDSLLRLSRAGRVQYQWQSLDVGAIVQEVVDALHDSISEKKAEIVIHPLAAAWGDPTAVEQIFANLLANAVSYLDPDRPGRIEVGSAPGSAADQISNLHVYYVRDNGLGIPEAYHDRVFTVFNRLHCDVAQGEGVGLALVRRMVERHGGKMWFESTAGVGTTFFAGLPAHRPEGVHSDRDRPVIETRERGES